MMHERSVNLNCCVDCYTRGTAILNQILSDVDQYDKPVELPPLLGNETDHCGIFVGSVRVKRFEYVKVTQRNITASTKHQDLLDIAKQDLSDVSNSPCVNSKTEQLNNIDSDILDKHCPLVTRKRRADKPQYINSTLDKLMKARCRAREERTMTWKFLSQLWRSVRKKKKRHYIDNRLSRASATKTWWK